MQNIVVVTGAASGIGQAIAVRAAEDDVKVVILDTKDSDETIDRIRANNGSAVSYRCDVRDSASVEDAFSRIRQTHGTVGVLINNAGTMGRWPISVSEATEQDWHCIFETNVKSAFLCCRQVLPYMRQEGKGAIVNIGSELAIVAAKGSALYCASKAAIVHFTRALAVDEAKHGILVNCICPGPVDTKLLDPTVGTGQNFNEARSSAVESTLVKRLGTPEEIATLTWFVASAGIGFMVGSAIVADGGVTVT